MSKLLLLITIMMLTTSSIAIECEKGGGITVKGNNGTEYCYSKNAMNWWTGLGWCQSIGRAMIRYPEDCRCVGDGCPEEMVACPNLKGLNIAYVWTATPFENDKAYYIKVGPMQIGGDSGRSGKFRILCY